MTLLSVRDVGVRYGDGPPIVEGVSFDLVAGGSLGIVGESGCGKTTLARSLVGWVHPSAGAVEVEGRAWADIGRRDPLRRAVQMIFQDPYASLNPRLTATQTVAEVVEVWDGASKADAAERARDLLDEVGLSATALTRRARELSGGQCQRVGIARALATRPRLLVADEPTSSLDVSVQAQILNLLLDLRASHDLALVLISHDLTVIRYMTEQALVMYAGRVVEAGPTEALFDRPEHPYTRLLLDSIPGSRAPMPPVVARDVGDAGCRFAARCPDAVELCLSAEPDLVAHGPRRRACHRPLGARGTRADADPVA